MGTNEGNLSFHSLLDIPPPLQSLHHEERGTNSTTTTRRSSCFEFCSGAYRRSRQRHLGQQIARRRFLQNGGSSSFFEEDESSSHNTTTTTNNNNLVFRRNVTVQDDWDTYEPYHQIEFLNQHDVVMAADKFGKVDIVRLPRYHSHDDDTCENKDDNDNDNDNDNHHRPHTHKPLGTLLAGKVELESNSTTPICHPSEGGHVKLKGIRNGDAFVVGTPSGDYHIFATEHASTGGRNKPYNTAKQPFDTTTPAIPIRQERLSTTTTTTTTGIPPLSSHNHNHSSRRSHSTTGTTKRMPASFVQSHGWNIPRPLRRFYRNNQDSKYSLQHMMRNPTEALSLCHSMFEIMDWSNNNNGCDAWSHGDHNFSNTGDLWDFRETSCSSLLAAHVDTFRDCFSLSIMDHRVVPHTSTTNNNYHHTKNAKATNHPSQQQHHHTKKQTVVCIDMTSQDNGLNEGNENITALCFASDHCLATAHSISQVRSEIFGTYQAPLQSKVKLWDLRMPTKALELPIFSSSERVGGERIPQFPYDHVYAYDDPISSFDLKSSQQKQHQLQGSSPLLNPATPHKSFIMGLCGPKEGEGTILLSTLTPAVEVVHSLLDLSRMEILPQQIRVPGPQHTSTKFYTNNSVSITPDHEFVASFTPNPSRDGEIVQLYDWSSHNRTRNQVHGKHQQHKKKKTPSSTTRKRSYPDEILVDNSANHEQSEPYQCGTIETKFSDRHGTRSRLTCLALNDCGSALVCGSDDGDLYLWQGG